MYIQECYYPEPANPLKEIITSPRKNKNNNRTNKYNIENDEKIIKNIETDKNDIFIYTTTENKKSSQYINNSNTNNSPKIIKTELKDCPTHKIKNESTDTKNILSTMMHTNINNARKNINNDNQIINESNSNSKIKIRKDLFNINDENTKYTNLDLEVINSWNLPKGLKLHINKDKLDNSLRKVNDGKIYFGYEQEYNNYINKESKLDYLLMPKDNEYDEKFIGIHFMIRYDEKKCKYYIKDLGSGYGTFIKLINPLEITNNLLVNIGDTFIVFNLDEDSKNISLKLFTGDEQSENYEFTPEKKLIRIGRDKESDIFIDDKLLSRKQCYIYYQEDENNENKYKWFIKDGDISGKKSTNDTWMYSIKDTLIYDQMIFKTNHNLFKCNCY